MTDYNRNLKVLIRNAKLYMVITTILMVLAYGVILYHYPSNSDQIENRELSIGMTIDDAYHIHGMPDFYTHVKYYSRENINEPKLEAFVDGKRVNSTSVAKYYHKKIYLLFIDDKLNYISDRDFQGKRNNDHN